MPHDVGRFNCTYLNTIDKNMLRILSQRTVGITHATWTKTLGRNAALQQALPFPTVHTFKVTNRTFHSSVMVLGRKAGSKALELPARAPSKKQKQKRSRFLEALAESRDPKKEKVRERNLARQVSSGRIGRKLDNMKEVLQAGMQSLMGPVSELEALLLGETEKTDLKLEKLDYQPEKVISLLMEQKQVLATVAATKSIVDTDVPKLPRGIKLPDLQSSATNSLADSNLSISPEWANSALRQVLSLEPSKSGSFTTKIAFKKGMKMFTLMSDCSIALEDSSYLSLLQAATASRKFAEGDEIFEHFLSHPRPATSTIERAPSLALWSAKVINVARSGRISKAISLIDSLHRLNLLAASPSPVEVTSMYNAVLESMVHLRQFEDAKSFWLRMHSDGISCNVQSFEIMLKSSSLQGEVERAFFLLDEMEQAYGLSPSKECFIALLQACGRGPYWVNGYERQMEEVMLKMEGKEMVPDVSVYNAIIESFGLAGDSVSAEYYFWEMSRKGITPNTQTYIKLLDAYAKNQSIGAADYGWKGRYHRPAEELLSEEEVAMKEVGAHRTAELLTSGMSSDVKVVKGKRVKSVLTDMLDDDILARESVLDIVRSEAFGENTDNQKETVIEVEGNGDNDFDFEAEMAKDPDLRRLMKDVEADLSNSDESEKDDEDDEGLDMDLIVKEVHGSKRMSNSSNNKVSYNEMDRKARAEDQKRRFKSPGALETEQQFLTVADRLRDFESESFSDPFTEVKGLKGLKIASPPSSGSDTDSQEEDQDLRLTRLNEQISLLDALDGSTSKSGSAPSSTLAPSSSSGHALELSKLMEDKWDMIEFGKIPPLDADHYLVRMPLSTRRKINKHRAKLAFAEAMKLASTETGESSPTEIKALWNKFLRVHTEAVHVDDATEIFESMKTPSPPPSITSDAISSKLAVKNTEDSSAFGPVRDSISYEYMIRMYVRAKDISKAVELKETMIKDLQLKPTSESFGLIIRAYTHRNQIVEALKTLEEANALQVNVHERNLTILRNRCNKLRIQHPALGEDPKEWVKDVKKVRRNMKESSRRMIQPLQFAAWH